MRIKGRAALAASLVLVLWVLPGIVLSHRNYVDPFLWTELSDVASAQNTGSLSPTYADSFAYSALLDSVSSITGIGPRVLSIAPIGAVITPLLSFVSVRRYLRSTLFASLFSLYVALDYTLASSEYSVFAYAWLHPLFLTFLFLIMFYAGFLRVPEEGRFRRNNLGVVSVLLGIFFAVFFFHPTYTLWIITLMVGFAAAVTISQKVGVKSLQIRNVSSLAACFVVVYLGFSQLFYKTFLRRAASLGIESIPEQSFILLRNLLGLGAPLSGPFSATPAPPTLIIGYAISIRTLLILSFVAGLLLIWILRNYGRIARAVNSDVILAVGLLVVGVSHTIGYALYGHLSLRFVVLAFPLVVLLAARTLNLTKIAVIFVAALLLLAGAQMVSYTIQVPVKVGALEDTLHSADWLSSHEPSRISILADFETSQTTLFHFRQQGKTMSQQFFTNQSFGDLVSNRGIQGSPTYVLVNIQETTTLSSGYQAYQPLASHSSEIDANQHLGKIYNDGTVRIYATP